MAKEKDSGYYPKDKKYKPQKSKRGWIVDPQGLDPNHPKKKIVKGRIYVSAPKSSRYEAFNTAYKNSKGETVWTSPAPSFVQKHVDRIFDEHRKAK